MVQVVFWLFIAAVVVQLMFYLLLFSRLALYKPGRDHSQSSPSVSIIICARNEAPNLSKNLPLILAQHYPDYEVIVVDDGSTDGTAELLAAHGDLRSLYISPEEKPFPGKKYPLSKGIAAAKGEILLLTDADCVPLSKNWVRRMVAHYNGQQEASTTSPDGQAEIVLGYGPYRKMPGLLNYVVRFETFMTFLQYASYALAGMPYMGVGRNISYKRALFEENGGFSSHSHINSGDDDLFINEVATSRNTRICCESEAFTLSEPPSSWGEWYRQKQRHVTTGRLYRNKHKLFLVSYSSSHIIVYVTFAVLLVVNVLTPWVIGAFGLRWVAQQWVFYRVSGHINSRDLWHFSTIFDFFYLGYYATFVRSALVGKNIIWR